MKNSKWTKADIYTIAWKGQERNFSIKKGYWKVKWLYTNFGIQDNQQQILTVSFYKINNAYKTGWIKVSAFIGIKIQLSVFD